MTYERTVLVTGGTSGLGYHAALSLARRYPEYLIVLASRSDREHAADSINKILRQHNVVFRPLDLSNLASVRSFVKDWQQESPAPIQIMLLNAALQFPGALQKSEDGIESTFAITHVGHALLFHLLFGNLHSGARIVITSSGVHDPANKTGMPKPEYISAEELAHPSEKSASEPGTKRYCNSKLANVLWTYALQRQLDELASKAGISVAAFDPGLMPGTGLAREYNALGRWVWNFILPKLLPLLRLFFADNVHLPEESGASLAWLASEAPSSEAAGSYYSGRKKIPSSDMSYEKRKQEDLWKWTIDRVGSNEAERRQFASLTLGQQA